MNRRLFLRNAGLLAAGVVAADQLELVERLGRTRRLFAGWRGIPTLYGDGWHDDTEGVRALVSGEELWDVRRGRKITGDGLVQGGRYRISGTIDVRTDRVPGPTRRLEYAHLHADPPFHGPMIRYSNSAPAPSCNYRLL